MLIASTFASSAMQSHVHWSVHSVHSLHRAHAEFDFECMRNWDHGLKKNWNEASLWAVSVGLGVEWKAGRGQFVSMSPVLWSCLLKIDVSKFWECDLSVVVVMMNRARMSGKSIWFVTSQSSIKLKESSKQSQQIFCFWPTRVCFGSHFMFKLKNLKTTTYWLYLQTSCLYILWMPLK